MKKGWGLLWCSIVFTVLFGVTVSAGEPTVQEFWNEVRSHNTTQEILAQHSSFEEAYTKEDGTTVQSGYEANDSGYGNGAVNGYRYQTGNKGKALYYADTAFSANEGELHTLFMGDNPIPVSFAPELENVLGSVSQTMVDTGTITSPTSAVFGEDERRVEVEVQDTTSWNIASVQVYQNDQLIKGLDLSYSSEKLVDTSYQALRTKFGQSTNQITIEDESDTYTYFVPDQVRFKYWYKQVAKDLFYDEAGTRSAQPVMMEGVEEDVTLYVREAITHSVQVLSTNDTHARVAGDDSASYGMARVKTLLEEAQKSYEKTLLLDAGDTYHGQAFATLEQGESIAKLMKAVGYHAMTAGNHDWNYGKDQLKKLEQLSGGDTNRFAMLCGNVMDENGTPFFDTPYLVEEIPLHEITSKTGTPSIKIGVFGIIDPAVYDSTAPANVAGLQFTDLVEYTDKMNTLLKEQGCDFIIGLVHGTDPKALAAKTEGVSLWISGHEHMVINEQVENKNGESVWIQQAGYYGSAVNEFTLSFRANPAFTVEGKGEYSILWSDATTKTYGADDLASVPRNEEIQTLYQNISDGQQSILQQVIGQTPKDLVAGWENVRIGETTMGRVVTDGYLLETGAEVALENAGGIRTPATVPAGEVTKETAINTFPFGNYIVTKKLTGQEIKDMLEISIELGRQSNMANDSGDYDAWPSNSGSYLQTSGLEACYDLSKAEGARIWSLKIQGKPMVEEQEYMVAMNHFLADSSDYPMIAAAEEQNQFAACDEAFIRYFAAAQVDDTRLNQTLETLRMNPKEEPASSSEVESSQESSTIPESSQENSTVPESSEKEAESSQSASTGPETGDDQPLLLFAGLFGVSGMALLLLLKKRQLKK